jgi:hypothetical protein
MKIKQMITQRPQLLHKANALGDVAGKKINIQKISKQ